MIIYKLNGPDESRALPAFVDFVRNASPVTDGYSQYIWVEL